MFDSGQSGVLAGVTGAVIGGLVEWARIDPAGCTGDEVREVLAVLEGARARIEGLTARWTAAAGAQAAVVQAELGVSAREARRRERLVAVAGEHGVVQDALAAGRLSADHVEVLARDGAKLPAEVVTALVAGAGDGGVEGFRGRVQHAALCCDGGDGDGAKRQWSRRSVGFRASVHGTVVMTAELLSDEADTLRSALDRVADQLWRAEHPDRERHRLEDGPTWTQRQADALVETARRILTGTTGGHGGTGGAGGHGGHGGHGGGGARPTVIVTVDLDTLRGGLHDRSVCATEWGTPLSAQTARRLACDAEIIPMVLGGRGEVLDVGRSRYTPTHAQRRAVKRRDRHCRYPGCDRPPAWCQIHHILDWHLGGPTDLDNLVLLCPRHHHLVHDQGWTINGTPPHLTFHPPTTTGPTPNRSRP